MKLFSQHAELRAIKSITNSKYKRDLDGTLSSKDLNASSFLLAGLDPSYFHYEPCKQAYERITFMLRKRSILLTFSDLTEDLSISEEYRDILREYKKKAVETKQGAMSLLETLAKYRKARILYFSAKDILEKLKTTEVDVDRLLDSVANKVTVARTNSVEQQPVHILGKDANSDDLLDRILSMQSAMLLKTGYVEFDSRNGGLPAEGVFLLAGTTSGGKSTLRMNLLANIYKLNKVDVCTVSFEQNDEKEGGRMLSCITNIPYWKFTKQALSSEDTLTCKKAWKRFKRFGEKNDCRYALVCPTRGLTLQQTFMILKPYGFKVIAIDYISLLEGVDDDNQARMLKSITREAKIYSAENKCLVMLLAQLDTEDNRIRYSRGILEDSDSCWVWNYSKQEDKDRKRLPIKQKKARDQEIFDFELEENFAMMQVLNPPEVLEQHEQSKNNTTSTSKRKRESVPQPDPLNDTPVEYDVG